MSPPSGSEHYLTGSDIDFSATLKIYVGSGQKLYHIHKRLLLGGSRILQCGEDSVNLPNEDPRLFQVYMEWVYSNRSNAAFDTIKALGVTRTPTTTEDMPGARIMIDFYVLGEHLGDVKFKNAVINNYIEVIEGAENCLACSAAQLYSQLPTDSPLKRLYVDMWAWSFDSSWFEALEPGDDPLAAPAEFWLDVVKKSAQYGRRRYDAQSKPPWVSNKAQYFEEEAEQEKEDEVVDQDEDLDEDRDEDLDAVMEEELF